LPEPELVANFPRKKGKKEVKKKNWFDRTRPRAVFVQSYEALLVVTRSIDVLVPQYGKGA
jgi:hypothetical protein